MVKVVAFIVHFVFFKFLSYFEFLLCVSMYPPAPSIGHKTRDKGLVTNYGEEGGYKTGGGQVKFYPYEKGGGAEKV